MSRRSKLIGAVLALAALLVLGLAIYRGVCIDRAEELARAGKYMAAREWYARIGSRAKMDECELLDREARYIAARGDMGRGYYVRAGMAFRALGEYRDCESLAKECDYMKACYYADRGQYRLAFAAFERLGDYSDARARIEQTRELLYQDALTRTYSLRLDEAAELWSRLGDYKDGPSVAERCDRIRALLADEGREKLLRPEKKYGSYPPVTMYSCDCGYIVLPEECDADTRFLLYYPGGWEQTISLDFVADYLLAPPENTIALLLYSNGVRDPEDMNRRAVAALEEAAAEKGVFVHELLVCGSSLGAYAAMQSVVNCYEELDMAVDCVLLLDAGLDWSVTELLPDEKDLALMAETGADIYLFEEPWVGMDKYPIRRMVENGNRVTLVACANEEHEAISHDALGKGVLGWALGDRESDYVSDDYRFVRLTTDSTYPY